MKKLLILSALITLVADVSIAQANPDDVKSPDTVIEAFYDVISGPAGPRDWDRFKNLFCEGATINSVSQTLEEEMYRSGTIHDYINGTSDLFSRSSFYEWELGRKTHELGSLVQVFSAFECKLADKMVQTGVNSIQMVKVEGRWRIANLTFNTHDKSLIEHYFK